MKAVFGDTFYWIALTFPGDEAYARAQQVKDDIVTTDEVLTEYLTFFSRSPEHLRRQAAVNVGAMLNDPTVRVIPQSRNSFPAGLELYRSRPDKGYSLTDCHLHADDAPGRSERRSHQRPAFRAGRLSRALS